jgi:hypothetical protein
LECGSIFKRNYLASYKKTITSGCFKCLWRLSITKVLQLNNIKEGFIVKGRAANASAVVQEARDVSSIAFWCRN